MFQYHIIVQGEVQGIGYRYFVIREAKQLKITGWVRNLLNGDVEIMAEGENETLDIFANTLKTKHFYARVENLKISKTEIAKNNFADFNITF
ncbi:MAG: acylphosphatase [Elusimicrobiota bacterium]